MIDRRPSRDAKNFTAHSLEEYQRICASLKNTQGKQVFFRGQVHGYEPQSSEERPPADDDDRIRRDLMREAWETMAIATLSGSGALKPAAVMGVLQHYGFRSWFIDITEDEMIGLWFARHKYTASAGLAPRPPSAFDGSRHEQDHVHIDLAELLTFDTVRHEPVMADADGNVAPGFVFVFAVDSDSPHLLDLRFDVGEMPLRVHRQSGSGLLPDNGNYDSFLVARIEVTFPAPADLHSGSTRLSTAELFPGPDEDGFYKLLLRTPRFPDDATELGESDPSFHPTSASVRTTRYYADPLRIPLYESGGMEKHIPLLWRYALPNYTTHCLSCAGITEVTIDMPFTAPGGARGSRFTPEVILVETRAEASNEPSARVHGHVSATVGGTQPANADDELPDSEPAGISGWQDLRLPPPAPFANWPAESRMFLRVPVLANLPEFVSRDDPYPVLRGFIVDEHSEYIEVWSVSELADGALSSWPSLQEDGLSFAWPLDAHGHRERLRSGVADEIDIALFGILMAAYFGALDRGEAQLFETGPHQFGFYWVNPDGVVPIGDRWTPAAQ